MYSTGPAEWPISIGIPLFCLTSCVSWIFGFRFYLVEHSRLRRWLERCIYGYYGEGRIAPYRSCRGPFHHYHWKEEQEMGFLLKVTTIIFGCIFSILFYDFRVRGSRSFPTPSMMALIEIFHKDAEINVHPLPVSWYFISTSLWWYLCSCKQVYVLLYCKRCLLQYLAYYI